VISGQFVNSILHRLSRDFNYSYLLSNNIRNHRRKDHLRGYERIEIPVPQEKFPVMGVAPAVIGSIQATEVIKYLVGIGKLLTNRLLIYDGLEVSFKEFAVNKTPIVIIADL